MLGIRKSWSVLTDRDVNAARNIFFKNEHLQQRPTKEKDKDMMVSPGNYVPDTVIGIDPGTRSLCTAIRVREVDVEEKKAKCNRRILKQNQVKESKQKRRKKQKKKRKRRHKHDVRRKRASNQQYDIQQISTREYRHLAGMNKCTFVREMSSFKTAPYEQYMTNVKYVWRHLDFLMSFCAPHPFRKWRFLQSRFSWKALAHLANRLVLTPSLQVSIGLADWSQQDFVKGHVHGPVKRFTRELAKCATVLQIDEYCTSQRCSKCYQQLEETPFPAKKADGSVSVKFYRQILRCNNSEYRITWD